MLFVVQVLLLYLKLACPCYSYVTFLIVSAARPENVANHCPLCHDNFPPGEEVRQPSRLAWCYYVTGDIMHLKILQQDWAHPRGHPGLRWCWFGYKKKLTWRKRARTAIIVKRVEVASLSFLHAVPCKCLMLWNLWHASSKTCFQQLKIYIGVMQKVQKICSKKYSKYLCQSFYMNQLTLHYDHIQVVLCMI